MIREPLLIDRIKINPGRREADPKVVAQIAASMKEVGQLHPITVVRNNRIPYLVAGRHRLEAARSIGLDQIDCYVIEDDMLDDPKLAATVEMIEIDENLCASRLSPTETARLTARRKALYEEKHPETVNGTNQHTRVGQVVQPSFADDLAAKIGADARTVRRHADRGARIADEALTLIKGTKLDTGSYLDQLKREPKEKQVAKVKADLKAPATAKTKTKSDSDVVAASIRNDLRRAYADAIDRAIANGIDPASVRADLLDWIERIAPGGPEANESGAQS